MPSFTRLAHLFRGRPQIDPAELDSYRQIVGPVLARLDDIYARWRDDLALDLPDQERANAASILRWEVAGLADRLEAAQPPAALTRRHRELQQIAHDTARASQLLSNGHRFNSSRTRCDGQALMLDCQEHFAALSQALAASGVGSTTADSRASAAPDAGAGAESDP